MTATAEAVRAAPQALVDPRVAKHGGTRKSAKSHYDFPGIAVRLEPAFVLEPTGRGPL